ncbi:MAG: oxidoreductase [Deltaproteobacteria bacterium]|nr:oxidoreductase [Deltaproteobacteria bacterium]
MPRHKKPKLAVWKFTSCDGCQLSILDCEEELLAIASRLEIAYFLEASKRTMRGPYDISIVEGSVSTPEEIKRIQDIRSNSRIIVTVGACAASGGIQALKNFRDKNDFLSLVYATPSYICTLDTALPISRYVPVNFALQGCPINKGQLLNLICALLEGRTPNIPTYSVCVECKLKGNICILVSKNAPCLGPVTQAGCGAICPTYNRACYGCFGPKETPNATALASELKTCGFSNADIARVFRTFNPTREEFYQIGRQYERSKKSD